MAISISLQNALSGLSAASRTAEAVSANVANATTPGFGKRDVVLGVQGIGGGVQIVRVERQGDLALLNDRRTSEANTANAQVQSDALGRLQSAVGLPEDAGSLTSLVAQFDARLIEAASRPDATARLEGAVSAGAAVANKLNDISDVTQGLRMTADQSIDRQVKQLNEALAEVERIDQEIFRTINIGRDANGLKDQRQVVIDSIAEIVPVRQFQRGDDKIALYTPKGVALFDGRAAVFEYSAVGVITPDMTQASGALSELTVNGNPVQTLGASAGIAGGSLAAAFAVRDELAVSAQADLDEVARDLIQRLEGTAVDPSLSVGDPGLFTDAGAVFDPLIETGLAARISLNANVDPSQGGESWRLRAGIGAAAPGAPSDSAQLTRWSDALNALAVSGSPSDDGIARSASSRATSVLTGFSTQLRDADIRLTYESARTETLRVTELGAGIDTDEELQKLLVIEQAYAANARVIQTVDEMLDTLLGI